MNNNNRDRRLRAVYAQVKALADDLPPIAVDRDAESYNLLVDELIELGYDAAAFKVDAADISLPVSSYNSVTGRKTYRETPEVHYHVLDRKVKSLLTFMHLTQDAVVVDVDLPKLPYER